MTDTPLHEPALRLAKVELFAGLSDPTLANVAAAMRERALSGGELLFGRGDPGDRLFLILDGRLRISVVTAEGRELSMRIAGPGEIIGEISAFDGGRRTTDVTAIEIARVAALPADAFFALLAQYPELARNALKFVCSRLRDTTLQLETIALYPIEKRVARLLLISLGETPAAPGRRPAVSLNLSQTEIAQLLGATRSKINVALGKLEEAGAIRRTSDRLFCDRDKLEQIAEPGYGSQA